MVVEGRRQERRLGWLIKMAADRISIQVAAPGLRALTEPEPKHLGWLALGCFR